MNQSVRQLPGKRGTAIQTRTDRFCKFFAFSLDERGGCPGNTARVAKLAVGRRIGEVIALLKGIPCRNGTSCPDQLAKALERELQGPELVVGG